jgi:hypothetical protein
MPVELQRQRRHLLAQVVVQVARDALPLGVLHPQQPLGRLGARPVRRLQLPTPAQQQHHAERQQHQQDTHRRRGARKLLPDRYGAIDEGGAFIQPIMRDAEPFQLCPIVDGVGGREDDRGNR